MIRATKTLDFSFFFHFFILNVDIITSETASRRFDDA